MTRPLFVILAFAAACGGKGTPTQTAQPPGTEPAPASAATADEPEAFASLTGTGEVAPEYDDAPAPARPPRVAFDYATLRDADGAVPGLDAFAIAHVADPTVCGGSSLQVHRNKRAKVPKEAEPFADLLELEPPRGLDFDAHDDAKQADAMARFDAWYQEMTQLATTAATHYRERMTGDARAAVAAAARIAQVARFSAARIARFEIPVNVRELPEAVEVFCDVLAEKAAPLLAYAADAETACGKHLAAAGKGWWTAVCPAPAP
jgi:hypothetical protein